MTAYSSQAITNFKKTIAHNAIKMDLQVREPGWEGDATTGFGGVFAPYPALEGPTLPPVSGPTGNVQYFVLGPAMNAYGGLDRDPGSPLTHNVFPPGSTIVREEEINGFPGYVCQTDPWTSLYHPWLERIDAALEGWDTLPDHSRFAQEAAKANAAVQGLTPTSGFGGQSAEEWRPTFTDPDRTTAFDLFSEYVGADVDSNMVYAFRSKYGPVRAGTVMQNQGQIAYGLTLILGGEAKLWEEAGVDIMKLCEAAEAAFHYEPPAFDFNFDLKIFKAFTDLAGTFVPAPAGTVLKGASAVAGFLQAVIPENTEDTTPPPPLSASTAEQVATNFEEAILTLRRATFHQEEVLYHCARRLNEDIGSVKVDYLHIHPGAGLDPGITTAEQIRVHTGALQDIGINQVPIIATIFAQAADDTYGLAPADIWTRGWPLGYGTSGPQENVAEILGEFDKVATGSARELVDAGKELAIAAGWIEGADQGSQADFTGLNDELERGRTEWEHPPPEPVLPPGLR
ncbi:hypothetical protein [Nocardioides humi]|uniref:Uncharacterized protein n=1 Tax=Nocardioides humi TaxID=449461 RepID=A0ABN1ZTE0_9ACTN|nr:hypothetical protein [Nocardioides humi]